LGLISFDSFGISFFSNFSFCVLFLVLVFVLLVLLLVFALGWGGFCLFIFSTFLGCSTFFLGCSILFLGCSVLLLGSSIFFGCSAFLWILFFFSSLFLYFW
jgi:hypothetical protein